MRSIARHIAALMLTMAVAGACRERAAVSTAPEPAPTGLADDGVPRLIITELMADPSAVADDVGEYIEVFNPGVAAVDMQGWRIVSGPTGAENHTIGTSFVVPSCGVALLVRAAEGNGGLPAGYSYGTSITLNNSTTDFVLLRRADNSPVDSVSYSSRNADGTVATPTFSPSAGISRVLVNPALDNTNIAGNGNWINTPAGVVYGAGDRGTPGVAGNEYAAMCGAQQPAGPPAAVSVSPAAASIVIGSTRALTGSALDAAGRVATTAFTWTSASNAVATVSATGVVTALATGTTTVTARSTNGIVGSATITVTAAGGAASVSVAINDPREIPVGFTKPGFPTVRDASNAVLTSVVLTWTTSDPSIATVDALGYVTGVQPGTVTVRATAPNGVAGANSITILPAGTTTSARYRNHLEFGTPVDATPADEQLIARTEFASSWNRTRGTPSWTSWNLNATQFGSADRCDCFSPDPLTPAPRIVDFDYRNGGYDRGHLVQSESRTATYQENAATFLLTNIIPQAANNNQGPWLAFENYLNDLVRTGNKEVYVIAGGEYAAGAPSLKGEGRVLVPDYTWKVAVVRPAGAGLLGVGITDTDVQVIAARFPNRIETGIAASAAAIRNTPWQTFQTTVDAIEAATGYDLLTSLPNDIESILERGQLLGAPEPTPALVSELSDALLSLARVRVMDKTEADGLAKALHLGLNDLDGKGPTALRAALQTFIDRVGKLPRSAMFTDAHANSWIATANGLLLRLQRAQ
ncbi:MAG TPA: DNA/RNA non-specific endonuclease [Gemmatimonas sp.]|nr:DNA/RNA non-specific endonuclease [Gemmatimonas sp.]